MGLTICLTLSLRICNRAHGNVFSMSMSRIKLHIPTHCILKAVDSCPGSQISPGAKTCDKQIDALIITDISAIILCRLSIMS